MTDEQILILILAVAGVIVANFIRSRCRHEFIVARPALIADRCRRRAKFRDDATVCSHGDPFASFNPAHVMTQIVFQFANACRHHSISIATCGHIGKKAPSLTAFASEVKAIY